MNIIASLVLLALAVVNWLRFRDFCYPGFLQAALWAMIAVLLSATWHLFIPISAGLFLILIAGTAMFSIGAFLATWHHIPIRTHTEIRLDSLPPRLLLQLVLLLVIAVSPLYFEKAVDLAKMGPADSFFINLRSAMTWTGARTRVYGILRYIVPLSFFIAACLELRYLTGAARKGKSLLALAVLLALGLGIFSTGRTSLFLLLTFLLGIPLILRRIRPRVVLAVFLSAGMMIFVSMGLLLGKSGSFGQSFFSITNQSLKSLFHYLLGPSVALDQLLQSEIHFALGQNTLRFFQILLSSLGDDIVPVPLIQPYVFAPFPVNVYTMYGPYYHDYGLLGVILAPFLWGLWHGFLYRRATTASPAASYVLLYALFLYPLFMQFFSDAYMTTISMWLQYLILVFLFTTLFASRGIKSPSQRRAYARDRS